MVKVGPALALYLGVLGERERVFDVDAEIANRTLDLGVAEQYLDRPEVAGRLVDDRRLCPPQRMRAVIFSAQPSASHPFVDQPGVLSGAKMLRAVVPARESIVVERAATMLKPRLDAGSRRLKQFELHGPAGLLLHNRRPRPDPAAADEIANTDFDDVAAAQLAVDGKVEQGPVTQPLLRSSQKRIAHTCCGFSARLAPTMRPAFHGRRSRAAGSNSECPIG
jgi:hypothetical protein